MATPTDEIDYSLVPPSTLALYNVIPPTRIAPTALGLTALELSEIIAHARTQNQHTKIAAKPQKLEKAGTFNSVHMNPFLRCYYEGSRVSSSTMQEITRMCINNEPEWVYRCQMLSLKALLNELEGKGAKLPQAIDEPVGMEALRRSLPKVKAHVPHFHVSCTHFKFAADAGGQCAGGATPTRADKDRYFSANVRIKNDGKHPLSVRVVQRQSSANGGSPIDTALVGDSSAAASASPKPCTVQPDTDFQFFLDKQIVQKGEVATILLSLIARPTAMFSCLHEIVVLAVDDEVKLVISFVVLNLSGPLFGVSLPCVLSSRVFDSPLGPFTAPIVLQLIKNAFVQAGGPADKDVLRICDTAVYLDRNRGAVAAAVRAKTILDEDCDMASLITTAATPPDTPTNSKAAAQTTTVLSPLELRCDPTPASASATHEKRIHLALPRCLTEISPSTLFVLALLWIEEFPSLTVDSSIITCNPFVYLSMLMPPIRGVFHWMIDFCCTILAANKGSGVASTLSIRPLAVAFASAMMHQSSFCARVANAVGELPSIPSTPSLEGRAVSRTIANDVNLTLHLTSAIVAWLTAYGEWY